MTHYQTLGVNRSATRDEIRSAYIREAKRAHPDLGGEQSVFEEIHAAYKILNHPTSRVQYNAWLDEHYKPCLKCSGRGVIIKTKSFKERTLRPCEVCRGSGVGDKK